jgi:hypothetical protein
MVFRLKEDRRDRTSREQLLRRTYGVFRTASPHPLSAAQATEQLQVRDDICMRMLATLVSGGFIAPTGDGTYALFVGVPGARRPVGRQASAPARSGGRLPA